MIIGLVFGAPVGAVGAMTIQRTLTANLKAGLITGIGSSVADCFYAAVGVFGVKIISDFMRKNHFIINLLCGFIILFLGISRFVQKPDENRVSCENGHIKMFLSSFLLGLMNPVAIMSFIISFGYIGI
jgi:threonine/homoserine/homoserine lactone efflux protein